MMKRKGKTHAGAVSDNGGWALTTDGRIDWRRERATARALFASDTTYAGQ